MSVARMTPAHPSVSQPNNPSSVAPAGSAGFSSSRSSPAPAADPGKQFGVQASAIESDPNDDIPF